MFSENGEICSGNGKCVCGQCVCNVDDDRHYSGKYCEKCPVSEKKHGVTAVVYCIFSSNMILVELLHQFICRLARVVVVNSRTVFYVKCTSVVPSTTQILTAVANAHCFLLSKKAKSKVY